MCPGLTPLLYSPQTNNAPNAGLLMSCQVWNMKLLLPVHLPAEQHCTTPPTLLPDPAQPFLAVTILWISAQNKPVVNKTRMSCFDLSTTQQINSCDKNLVFLGVVAASLKARSKILGIANWWQNLWLHEASSKSLKCCNLGNEKKIQDPKLVAGCVVHVFFKCLPWCLCFSCTVYTSLMMHL